MKRDNRPVNLDLTQFSFPLPAITSILHRITGVILLFGVGFLLWGLDQSLESQQSFDALISLLDGFLAKLIVWGILAALLYHLVAGFKHLFMDLGIGETLEGGQTGAKVVLVVAVVLILAAGVWVW
ncbi:MAG: succinate dehydrogenase, cytochrome b556 subunit [Gammaproteobacteria bacterium]|nr:MAG: succinate dehydrogenase, cytochrome b556 subunit [Gammaproteobacteria bacterium]